MLFVIGFLTLTGFSQTVVKTDSTTYEKARYLKEDLGKFLSKNVRYPKGNSGNIPEGEVIYSFVINKNGKLENLQLEDSQDSLLSKSAYAAMIKLDNSWSPAKVNQVDIDKDYTIVFRYRLYANDKTTEYKMEIAKLVKKQKYDLAIKLYDVAISENQYDFKLLAERSKLKDLVGDKEGAIRDLNMADKLNADIMLVVNVVTYGNSRTASGVGFP